MITIEIRRSTMGWSFSTKNFLALENSLTFVFFNAKNIFSAKKEISAKSFTVWCIYLFLQLLSQLSKLETVPNLPRHKSTNAIYNKT